MYNNTHFNTSDNNINDDWINSVNNQSPDNQNFIYGQIGITNNNNRITRNSVDNNYGNSNRQDNFVGQVPTGITNNNGFVDQDTIIGQTNNNRVFNRNRIDSMGIGYQNSANNGFVSQNNYFNHPQNFISDKDQQLVYIISLLHSIENVVNQLLNNNKQN